MAVFLSAARIPASRGERKSKDPEDVYPAIQLQGVLLKHFSEPCLPAAIENSAIRIQLEFPDATLTKGCLLRCFNSLALSRSHPARKDACREIQSLPGRFQVPGSSASEKILLNAIDHNRLRNLELPMKLVSIIALGIGDFPVQTESIWGCSSTGITDEWLPGCKTMRISQRAI